ILLCSRGAGLAGLYFIGQKDCPNVPGVPPPQQASPAAGNLNGRPIRSLHARRRAPEPDLFGEENLARTAGHQAGVRTAVQTPSKTVGCGTNTERENQAGALELLQADTPVNVQDIFARAGAELGEYFEGARRVFSVPLQLDGTPFQQRVWQALLRIPYGEYVSYGDVAVAAGMTRHHGRPVGAAVGQNPVTIIVPCHRVLASSGQLNGYSSGLERKVALLELEGFEVGWGVRMPKSGL